MINFNGLVKNVGRGLKIAGLSMIMSIGFGGVPSAIVLGGIAKNESNKAYDTFISSEEYQTLKVEEEKRIEIVENQLRDLKNDYDNGLISENNYNDIKGTLEATLPDSEEEMDSILYSQTENPAILKMKGRALTLTLVSVGLLMSSVGYVLGEFLYNEFVGRSFTGDSIKEIRETAHDMSHKKVSRPFLGCLTSKYLMRLVEEAALEEKAALEEEESSEN